MREIEIYEKICRGIPITKREFEIIRRKYHSIPIIIKNEG